MDYARKAWDATKDATDAPYDQTEGEFRGKLDFAAERAMATGIANTPFEQKVLELAEAKDAEDQAHPLHVGVLSENVKQADVEAEQRKRSTGAKTEAREVDRHKATATPGKQKEFTQPAPVPNVTAQDAEMVAKEGIKPAAKPDRK